MEYNRLGNSGLQISKVILGCMSYGSKDWAGWVEDDEDKVLTVMKAAYDAGIRTFDTANVYSGGLSERLVRKFMERYSIPREKMVIISKTYFLTGDPKSGLLSQDLTSVEYLNQFGLSRKNILESVKNSCERLGTYIDVLLIHRLDRSVPKTEIMEALHDVVKSNQVRYIGASTMMAYEFIQLQNVAETHNWTKFICMENYYNLLYREEEREMIPYCNETGVGLIPWSPVARGVLTRPFLAKSDRSEKDPIQGMLGLSDNRHKEIVDRVEKLAKDRGVAMATVATAWTIAKGCSPIVGISKVERIADLVAAVKFKLSEDEMTYLEENYVPSKVTGFA